MNSLYNCSWVTKTKVLQESYEQNHVLLVETLVDVVRTAYKKMDKLKIGDPYRDARLLFYQFLQDEMPDAIPDEYKKTKFISPEDGVRTALLIAQPEKRLTRLKKEDEDFKYKLQGGSTRLLFTLKDKGQKDLRVSDLKPEDIEKVEEIISRKLYGTNVNHLYLKIVGAQKDPTAFIKEIEKKFNEYIESPHEGSKDDRLTWYLNFAAGERENKSGRNKPVNPETGKRDLPTLPQISQIVKEPLEGVTFTPGTDAYNTLTTNLEPEQRVVYVARGAGDYEIFKVRRGKYEYRINLRGLGSKDLTVGDIGPENLGPLYVYDLSQKATRIEDLPGGIKQRAPTRIYEPGFEELPAEEPGESDDTLPETPTRRNQYDDEMESWEEESEETPCVHGCKCSKCMQTNSKPVAQKTPQITIKLSTEAVNKQMIENFRKKQQNNHRIDRRHMFGY